MNVRGSLSRETIARFLSVQTIPIRIGCRTPSGHPWMLSMWYRSRAAGDDGSDEWVLECATGAEAKVVTYLTENPEVSFEISTNQPPYTGVRGRGTATIEPDPEKDVLRSLVNRYLGGPKSTLAQTLLSGDREEVTITIEPSVVYGWDFSQRMREFENSVKKTE
ncbi:pyridoxamine 5'-phosphate oxidase family protein [Halostagnicola sp. A-GB9-2]|uniref:pyridoxamine 5'-phosphate oxidase family protein n=1 Tax=Halostagnicola sp. A-GB9-2 TaxID=3048066 RepID=UPI0024C04BB8|nr:pyridoxamine 5'-phosphate oxidase family protein [Halostagnicola sp. A-GB9-2]MDJ1431911.1 pyridoxamine 5'-phosphate oxidase family protein [Halostagnicola sp. A-GB9-2]